MTDTPPFSRPLSESLPYSDYVALSQAAADDNAYHIDTLRKRFADHLETLSDVLDDLERVAIELRSDSVYDIEFVEGPAGRHLPTAMANIQLNILAIRAMTPKGDQ